MKDERYEILFHPALRRSERMLYACPNPFCDEKMVRDDSSDAAICPVHDEVMEFDQVL